MSLRVATFNLKDFFEPRREAERSIVERKLHGVAALLRDADADVVALQEVGSSALLERLLREHLADLRYGEPHLGPRDRRGIGNAIVTRLPILERRVVSAAQLELPRFVVGDPEPYPNVPLRRAVVQLTVDAPGLGAVDVLTIHFKSQLPTPLKDAAGEPVLDRAPRALGEAHLRSLLMRSAEALHLRALVDQRLDRDAERAVVALGDFNDELESLPVRTVRGSFYFVDPARTLESCTARVPAERRFSILHGGAPQLIDHVLVSRSLAARLDGARIANEALRDHGPYVPDGPIEPDSDHAPVIATFR